MNFAMPEEMKHWIRAQVDAGAYSSASHYIRTLVERDQAQVSMLDELRRLLHCEMPNELPSRAAIAQRGRRQDADAWEAVFKYILNMKRDAVSYTEHAESISPRA